MKPFHSNVKNSILVLMICSTLCVQIAHAQSYLYVGDYDGQQVDRFQVSGSPLTETPNPTGSYINVGSSVEGMGGTDALLAVSSGRGIQVYNITGNTPTLVRTINTLSLRIDFNPTASILYATPFNGAGSPLNGLASYNFATGAKVGATLTPGNDVWGEAYHVVNGTPYVFFTTGWTGGNAGVYRADLNADGSFKGTYTTIVAPGASVPNGSLGLTSAAGITFAKDGSFYVANGANGDPRHGFINHYNADGSFKNTILPPTGFGLGLGANPFFHAFDLEIGSDGDLYLASQQANCITQIDTVTDTVLNDQWVSVGSNGLVSTKTLHFSSNNVGVPEPSVYAFAVASILTGAAFLRRRRKADKPV